MKLQWNPVYGQQCVRFLIEKVVHPEGDKISI